MASRDAAGARTAVSSPLPSREQIIYLVADVSHSPARVVPHLVALCLSAETGRRVAETLDRLGLHPGSPFTGSLTSW